VGSSLLVILQVIAIRKKLTKKSSGEINRINQNYLALVYFAIICLRLFVLEN
jgi:hypothetical protein